MMRLPVALLFIFYVLLSTSTSSGTSGDDRRWLASFVELVEFDYEDQCDQRATAAWNELLGASNGLSTKLERDKAFGLFSRQQTLELRDAVSVHHTLGSDDDILRRKVKLLLLPGDTLLYTEPWIRLVTFADTSLNKLRFATDYYCGADTNCTLRELHTSLAKTQDVDTLLHMKQSWEKKLPDMKVYLEQILPLLINSSKENNYETVEQYWDSLAEYEGAILKARELWDNIKPLYSKLHKYVALRLKGSDAVGKPLPVHLLRSLTGEDWINLIEVLLPKHADLYHKIHANMHLKDLGGIKAFEEAEKLIKMLNLGDMEPGVWSESAFNGTCPATLVDWCKPNKLKVVSCKDISIGNYIDAHETAMKIKYKQTNALYSNNTYILREAPRYSAVYEAIPGFASLLALTPHSLDRAGLYNFGRFNLNPNYHRLVLQLIIALRDLPKLNYYLAVDEWRLKLLMGSIPPAQAATSWAEFRRNFSDIDTTNEDVLGDPYVLFNRPYIGKFMGIILKYQVYQSFAEELISDESDLVKHVAENNDRILITMMQGFGVEWPEIVSDLLAKRENGLEYTAITDYFRFLDEYLDSQFEVNAEPESDDYVEPPIEPEIENEIPIESKETKDSNEVDNVIAPETHEDIQNNLIDTDDANSKFGLETSTIGVLEIKKQPVGSAGQKTGEVAPQEASYSMYWWVGVAVALGIVIILIAIIARKRHNHRKQLERQRENSCA